MYLAEYVPATDKTPAFCATHEPGTQHCRGQALANKDCSLTVIQKVNGESSEDDAEMMAGDVEKSDTAVVGQITRHDSWTEGKTSGKLMYMVTTAKDNNVCF